MTDLRYDFAEPRLLYDRLAITITGRDIDGARSGNVWVCPVTGTLMLLPLPLAPEWQTTASPPYDRLRLADTNRAADPAFGEYQRGFNGNYWIHAAGLPDHQASARAIKTNATYPKNQAWYVATHLYAATAEQRVTLEVNMLQGATQPGVGVRFWADGRAEIWRGDTHLDTIDLRSSRVQESSSPVQSLQNVDLYALLIPYRRRSLLIATSIGAAEYVFSDLDPDAQDPEITPAGALQVYVPTGVITVQFAPVRYRASGNALSRVAEYRYAPNTGRSMQTTVYYDLQGRTGLSVSGSLRKPDGSAFTPDGVQKQCRLRIDLTGDGAWTPFVYGASSVIAPEFTSTPDAPQSLWELTESLRIRVGEEPDEVELQAVCQWQETFRLVDNRAVEFVWQHPYDQQSVPLFRGRLYPPDVAPGRGAGLTRMELLARDLWRALDDAVLFDPTPLDGLELSAAIRELCHQAGLPDSLLQLTDTGFNLPTSAAQGAGEWAVYPRVGDTVGDWVRRLWQTYAWDWFLGFKPTPSGWKLALSEYDDAVRVDLYLTISEAQAQAGAAWYWQIVQDLRHDLVEPEANEVIVTGWDPNRRRPVQAIYRDELSMDPTLAPAARPENWIGAPRRYGWVDTTITRLADAERVRDLLSERLTQRRYLAEWRSPLLTYLQAGARLPIWRGDVVGIIDGGVRYKYRVLSVEMEVVGESSIGLLIIGRYRGEKIGEEPL